MKRFFIRVGNVHQRKGHRQDCSHVMLTFEVWARDKADALCILEEAHMDGELFNPNSSYDIKLHEWRLNLDTINENDIERAK